MINGWKLRKGWGKACYTLQEVPRLSRFFAAYGVSLAKGVGNVGDDTFYRLVARHVAGTAFSPAETLYFRKLIDKRGLNRWAFPFSFFRLPAKIENRLFKMSALSAHHSARVKLVLEHLPPADDILDLGGAADKHPEGALLSMGYPHVPKHLCIVDLPFEQRIYTKPIVDAKSHRTKGGTDVTYVYTSMSDLSPFPDRKFDLVWSGQSIEHVSEVEGEKILEEVFRVLKPGGCFCLDTPNRGVTRLISGDHGFIHPEHKIEYRPSELVEKLKGAGFEIEAVKAVTPLPISRRLGRFCKLEAIEEIDVSGDYDSGFSFFVKCRKPKGTDHAST